MGKFNYFFEVENFKNKKNKHTRRFLDNESEECYEDKFSLKEKNEVNISKKPSKNHIDEPKIILAHSLNINETDKEDLASKSEKLIYKSNGAKNINISSLDDFMKNNKHEKEDKDIVERFKEYNLTINSLKNKINNEGFIKKGDYKEDLDDFDYAEEIMDFSNVGLERKDIFIEKKDIFIEKKDVSDVPMERKDVFDDRIRNYYNTPKTNKYTEDEINRYIYNETGTQRYSEEPHNKDIDINNDNLNNIRKLVKLKLYAEALDICNKILQSDEIDPNVYLYLGIINYGMGNYDESIKNYTIGIKNDNKNYKLHNNRGTAYIEKNEYVFAILDFTKAIELMPNLSMLYENRARAYFKIEMYEDALEDIDKALSIDYSEKTHIVKGEILCRLKKYDESIREYNNLIDRGYNDKNIYLNIAEVYFEKKDYENAIINVKKVIKSNPKDYKPYYIIGNISFAKKEISNAINNYLKVLEINNSHGHAYFKLGLCYFSLDEYQKCIENMNNAEVYGIKDMNLFSNRGESYLALGKFDEAIKDLNTAIEINPSSFGTYFDRGVAYTNLKIYDKAYNDLVNSKRLMEMDNNANKYYDIILTVDKMISDLVAVKSEQ